MHQRLDAFTLKGRPSFPVSSWLLRYDLTLEEGGIHDDNFKIPTVARRGVITCGRLFGRNVSQPLSRRVSSAFEDSVAG